MAGSRTLLRQNGEVDAGRSKEGLKLVERPITNLVYKHCYGVDGYGFGICEVCRGSDLGHIPNHTDRRDALRSTVLAQSSSLPASDWGLLREIRR